MQIRIRVKASVPCLLQGIIPAAQDRRASQRSQIQDLEMFNSDSNLHFCLHCRQVGFGRISVGFGRISVGLINAEATSIHNFINSDGPLKGEVHWDQCINAECRRAQEINAKRGANA